MIGFAKRRSRSSLSDVPAPTRAAAWRPSPLVADGYARWETGPSLLLVELPMWTCWVSRMWRTHQYEFMSRPASRDPGGPAAVAES